MAFESPTAATIEPSPIQSLTRAIRNGDEQAFNRFYELYHLRLYRQALLLSHGDEPEARETLQTVVLKLAKKFPIFDEEMKFWAWLCACLRNAYVDRCRARRRNDNLVSLDGLVCDPPATDSVSDPWSEALRRALDEFAPDEQELLRAAYIDERPLHELAENANRTYKAIESHLGRLRQKLKARLLNHIRHE